MSSYEVVLANLNTLGISSNKMPPPPKLKKVIGIMIIKGSVLIGYVGTFPLMRCCFHCSHENPQTITKIMKS